MIHYCFVHPNQFVVYFKVHDILWKEWKGGWIGFRINCSCVKGCKALSIRMDGKEVKSLGSVWKILIGVHIHIVISGRLLDLLKVNTNE